MALLGGLLLWTFGRNATHNTTHIGASGLVFGLIAFLIVSGIVERRIVPLLVTVVVMSQIARKTGLRRESLYKALSPHGNPEFATVLKVVRALGIELHAEPTHVP